MPSPILARADALMQRRRQNAELDDVPVLTDAIDLDDDVPVLFDAEPLRPIAEPEPSIEAATEAVFETIIAPVIEASPVLAEAPTPSRNFDAGVRDILAHELARRVEQRIMSELPRIIESTVRDFLAEQQMISALQPDD